MFLEKEVVISRIPASFSRLHRHADAAGATASTLCLIHCVLTPIIVSIFPNVIPYLPGDTWLHRVLAVGVVLFGLAGFLPGYRVHRRKSLLLLIGAGMSLILVVAWGGDGISRSIEFAFSISGSLMLVMAHLFNRSFCRQCRSCGDLSVACHSTQVESLQRETESGAGIQRQTK